jgi:hypothetical protein
LINAKIRFQTHTSHHSQPAKGKLDIASNVNSNLGANHQKPKKAAKITICLKFSDG